MTLIQNSSKQSRFGLIMKGFVLVDKIDFTKSKQSGITLIYLVRNDSLTREFLKMLHAYMSHRTAKDITTPTDIYTPSDNQNKLYLRELDSTCKWSLTAHIESSNVSILVLDVDSQSESQSPLETMNNIRAGYCPMVYIDFMVQESRKRLHLEVHQAM